MHMNFLWTKFITWGLISNISATILSNQPPCTLEEMERETKELQSSIRKMSANLNSPGVPCKPIYPCEIPSATSRQDAAPRASSQPKSLPASSTKIDDFRERNLPSNRIDEDRGYARFKEDIDRKEADRKEADRKKADRKEADRKCKAIQTTPSDIDDVCSNICLNMWVWIHLL